MFKKEISDYLLGNKLYGDDLSLKDIESWYKDEEEGYANLGAKEKEKYQYVYHEINKLLGFSHINKNRIHNVLGLGSAYGEEFLPIIDKIENITILERSKYFSNTKEIHGTPCKYVKPNINGDMPFADNKFELIVIFSALHHIPNVTHVLKECNRVLSEVGVVLVREPIVSMGDWSKNRKGLTKNERGIPLDIFKTSISRSGFEIRHQSLWNFSLLPKIFNKFGVPAYNNAFLTKLDLFLSHIFRWNLRYHASKLVHKFRPASVFMVLTKVNTIKNGLTI